MTRERAAYVMAMAILQSSLYEKDDEELQEAVQMTLETLQARKGVPPDEVGTCDVCSRDDCPGHALPF